MLSSPAPEGEFKNEVDEICEKQKKSVKSIEK